MFTITKTWLCLVVTTFAFCQTSCTFLRCFLPVFDTISTYVCLTALYVLLFNGSKIRFHSNAKLESNTLVNWHESVKTRLDGVQFRIHPLTRGTGLSTAVLKLPHNGVTHGIQLSLWWAFSTDSFRNFQLAPPFYPSWQSTRWARQAHSNYYRKNQTHILEQYSGAWIHQPIQTNTPI